MKSSKARWIALCLALLAPWGGARAQADATPHHAAHDLLDPGVEATLRPPPLPRHYTVIRRGPIDIAYPPAIESQVRDAIANIDRDADALARQLGMVEVPQLEVRFVPDPETMRRLAPVEAPPPAYAVGVAYPAIALTLVSTTEPATWRASDVRRVLRHELSHLLLGNAARHPTVPRWFSEGLAVHQAAENNYDRFTTLATASFTNGLLPLRHLDSGFNGGEERVNIAYAESADFVSYLMRSEGNARFSVLIGHLRAGSSFDEAIRQTYGSSLTQLELEWRDDVRARFLTAPLWAGTGMFWLVGALLTIVAFWRRRRTARSTIARWEREDAIAEARRERELLVARARWEREQAARAAMVPVYSVGALQQGGSGHLVSTVAPGDTATAGGAAVVTTVSTGSAASDRDVPQIELDGERHTLH